MEFLSASLSAVLCMCKLTKQALCGHNMKIKKLRLARFLETWCDKILFSSVYLKTPMEVSVLKQILRAFIRRLDSAIVQA